MEEKSLEELVTELSNEDNITVTNNDTITIDLGYTNTSNVDLGNIKVPDMVSVVSQSPIQDIKQEVQEMVEEQHNDFYNQNIEKDMDVLEKEYVKMERNAYIIDAKIIRLKVDNKEIFDKLEALEKDKEKALEHKEDYREVIARKLATIGEKKWKGMEVEFTYYAPSFKKAFNKKRFEAEQPNMYAKYVDDTPVKEYIKTKLSLMPIVPEDFKEGDI